MNDDIFIGGTIESDSPTLPPLPAQPLYWRSRLVGCLLLAVFLAGLGSSLYIGLGRVTDHPPVAVPSCGAPQPTFLRYDLDPQHSEARFDVDIQRLNPSRPDRITGATADLSGFVLVDPQNPQTVRLCQFRIGLATLTMSGALDGLTLPILLQTQDHPEAVFGFGQAAGLPANLREWRPFAFTLNGLMSLKGITASSHWEVRVVPEPDRLTGQAQGTILLSDYQLGPIKLDGVLESADDVSVTVQFVAMRQK